MNLELIHKYLNSEMTNQEHAAFELRMLKEPELAEEVALQKDLIAFSNIENQTKKAHLTIKQVGEEFRPNHKEKIILEKEESKTSKLIYWMPISIAALFLVGFFINQLMLPIQLSSQEIYSQYATVSHLSFASRSTENNNLLITAQNAFNEKNYNLAVAEFEKVLMVSPNNLKALYHQAYSKIMIDDIIGGRKDFTSLLENPQYRNSALYQLALSFVKTDQYNDAIPFFEKIESSSNHYENAQQLIELIR